MENLLHLTHTDIRSDSRILKEMEAASKSGYRVYGIGIELSEGAQNINGQGFEIKTISLMSRNARWLPKPLRHFLTFVELFIRSFSYALRVKPGVIHSNDTLVLPIAVFVKLLTGAKLVYDAHELESDRNGLSKFLGVLTRSVEKLCWPFVNAQIVVSPSIQAWYQENIGEKKSEVILNAPIYEQEREGGSDYLRKRFGIPEHELIFIYIGILGAGRGIDLILEAFKQLSGAHVVFLGYGEYVGMLKDFESQYKNVHVHEAVEHGRVVEVASSADVGLCLVQNVSLSDYYCLPNKLFEYAFAGLPVLASRFPDIQTLVDDHSLGLCVDLDPESISYGVQWFLDNWPRPARQPEDLHSLSWQEQEVKLINLYESLR